MNKINVILPDFLNIFEAEYLKESYNKYPNIFRNNINIFGFWGKFPGCEWNEKNRNNRNFKLNEEVIEGLYKKYKQLKTNIFLVFDKEEISPALLKDEYSNKIVEIFNSEDVYVICSSRKLEEYIKDNYKKIKIVSKFDKNCEWILNCLNDIQEEKNNIIVVDNSNVIGEYKEHFRHCSKENIFLKKRKNRYKLNKTAKPFYKKNDEWINKKSITRLIENNVKYVILPGLGVANIAMMENIIEILFLEEHQLDQRAYLIQSMMTYIEMEYNEIYKYRM